MADRDRRSSAPKRRRKYSIWSFLAPVAFVVVLIAIISAVVSTNFHDSSSTSSTSTTSTTLPPNIANANHYVVKNGDTAGSIAAKFDLDVAQLEHCNPNIVDIHQINVGEYLNVGQKCRVAVSGDSDE